MNKKQAFTLVEVLVSIALTGIILTAGYMAFQGVMRAQSRLSAAIDVQRNLFYLNEKIAHLIRSGGTIDYEEYFNRRMLGYDQDKIDTNTDTIPDTYTFSKVSKFGNGNNPTGRPDIYFCGVDPKAPPETDDKCLNGNAVFKSSTWTNNIESTPNKTLPSGHQPYGQYRALAWDYDHKNNGVWVPYPYLIPLPPIFSQDVAPPRRPKVKIFNGEKTADIDPSLVGLPELYLIKKELNGDYTRTYFRHVYIKDENSTSDCTPTDADDFKNCRGKIQILKLQSCDEIPPKDGIIDAWIPDADFSSLPIPTKCDDINNAPTINTAADNAVWRDLTSPDLNVIRATFLPSPLKIPELIKESGATGARITLRLDITLSEGMRRRSSISPDENIPHILMTTYDLTD